MYKQARVSHVSRWATIVALALVMAMPGYGQEQRGFKVKKDSSESGQGFLAYRSKYALVVGINEYQDSSLPNLQYAVSDAEAVKSILVEIFHYPEENVVLLKDELATRETIMSSLSRYIEDDIDEESQLLVYFAGHGTTIGNEFSQLGYLLPHDTKVGSQRETYSTGIPMDEIQRISRTIRPKHVLFLMDACYGGLANARGSKSSVFVRNALDRKARQLITAGSADEEVVESAEWGHSALTKVLIDALGKNYADSNEDGIISVIELFSYIENRVPYYAESKGGKQTPQYSKLTPEDGTFLFIRNDEALANLQGGDESLLDLDTETIARRFTTPVHIKANVDNARVYIEGKEAGYLSKGTFDHDMSPGFYKIELRKEKYENVSKELEVLPDTSVAITFDMAYIYSKVHFDVQPKDAAVYIDDSYVGSGSFRKELPKGRHKIAVSKSGFKPDTSHVNLTLDSLQISVQLEYIEARIELRSVPERALVVVSGDSAGYTPIQLSLNYGRHDIYLSKKNYRDYYLPLEISDSQIISKTIRLRETPEVIARRTYNTRMVGHVKNVVVSGGIAVGGLVGSNKLKDLAEEIGANEDESDDSEEKVYEVARWVVLGVAGLSVLNGVSNLIRMGSLKYSRILEEQLELEVNKQASVRLGVTYDYEGAGLRAVMSF